MSAFWFLCTTHTHTSDEWKTIYYLVLHVLMYKYMNVWIYICFVVFLLFVFHIRFQWGKLSLERVWSVVLLFCNFVAFCCCVFLFKKVSVMSNVQKHRRISHSYYRNHRQINFVGNLNDSSFKILNFFPMMMMMLLLLKESFSI